MSQNISITIQNNTIYPMALTSYATESFTKPLTNLGVCLNADEKDTGCAQIPANSSLTGTISSGTHSIGFGTYLVGGCGGGIPLYMESIDLSTGTAFPGFNSNPCSGPCGPGKVSWAFKTTVTKETNGYLVVVSTISH